MKIAVLVSGGVDSSVALKLLKDQGHDITAFYLKIWLEDELSHLGNCPWEEDLNYVKKVCKQLEVPLEVMPLQDEYHNQVVSYTINEIKKGRTPNPDILCNQHIKFGAFFDAIGTDFDKVATGHYAQIRTDEKGVHLHRSADPVKDQTYFLSQLCPAQLERALFPIGHLTKSEVRKLAQKFDLPTKDRKDSQGICFLGKLKFDEFVKYHLGEQEGDLIEIETGQRVGSHQGFWFYTIGQRQGIGLAAGPWYVVDKDPEQNIVYISRHYYAPDKKRDTFEVSNLHWLSESKPIEQNLKVKLRHGIQLHDCTINFIDEDRVCVQLATRDQGIAPGQFAVFYDGDRCLGSGVIQVQKYAKH